jgi:branched-chain amino acid transport system substrate-binding protein
VIGGDFATTGADASAGVPTQNGAILAIEQEAKRGLPGGYTLEARMLDDTVGGVHDPAQGARNVESLLQDPDVLAIVGPQNSSVARAEIPIANLYSVALVSPTSTSVELTDDSAGAARLRKANPNLHTFFRTVLRDDLQGAADAQFALTQLGVKRAYVIDDDESYGRGIADVFAREFAASGGIVLERAHLTPGQQDFVAMLTRAQSFHPDLFYYGGVVSTGAPLLRRQMLRLGMTAKFMGGDGIKEQGFIDAAGAAADGAYCSDGSPNLAIMPSATRFLRDYAARFPGQVLGTYSANAYVAAQVIAEAIRTLMQHNGGVPPTRAQVVRQIASSVTADTPLGTIAFTPQGDVTAPVVSIWTIKNGQFVFLTQERKALR